MKDVYQITNRFVHNHQTTYSCAKRAGGFRQTHAFSVVRTEIEREVLQVVLGTLRRLDSAAEPADDRIRHPFWPLGTFSRRAAERAWGRPRVRGLERMRLS